eukprot:TRINITY_DN11766_c0_g1_i1.p1 TRINITY_DN11766_c0_g1~~TRINITY_DN11766_c0_g1_i1.p1  ORF type:complete len:123 (+),score=25.15 TRINITY_DN11766_c0_g1_i1:115-483(+)
MIYWGKTVSSEKPVRETLVTEASLVVTQATLRDPETPGYTILTLTVGAKEPFTIATFGGRFVQFRTDIFIQPGAEFEWKVKGKGSVDLIGYFSVVSDSVSDSDSEMDSEKDSSVDSDPDLET